MDAVFEFGEFRLDRTVLEHRGQLVPLAPKSQELLYLLVSRAPETLSKVDIFAAVWPGTYVVESSLTRNISVIRKALEDRAAGPFIETIPKRGYRFVGRLKSGEDLPPSAPILPPPGPLPPAGLHRRTWILGGTAGALALAGSGAVWWRRRAKAAAADDAEQAGRALLTKATPADVKKALEWMERAVAENPESASAHAGLAEVLLSLPAYGVGRRANYPRALAEAEHAVRLDGSSAQAHAILGACRLAVEWDFPAAGRSLQQARQLDPDNPATILYSAQWFYRSGRLTEAEEQAARGAARHPLMPLFGTLHGRYAYYRNEFGRAERELLRVLEREPRFALAHYYLALALGFMERFEDASQHFAQANLNEGMLRADRAWLDLRRGNRGPAEEAFVRVKELEAKGTLGRDSLLMLAAVLGDYEAAFGAINVMLRDRHTGAFEVRADPRFAEFRRDRRYAEVEAAFRALASGPRR